MLQGGSQMAEEEKDGKREREKDMEGGDHDFWHSFLGIGLPIHSL